MALIAVFLFFNWSSLFGISGYASGCLAKWIYAHNFTFIPRPQAQAARRALKQMTPLCHVYVAPRASPVSRDVCDERTHERKKISLKMQENVSNLENTSLKDRFKKNIRRAEEIFNIFFTNGFFKLTAGRNFLVCFTYSLIA